MELLDRLGHASSKADEGPREAGARPGWKQIPSSARADQPLPRHDVRGGRSRHGRLARYRPRDRAGASPRRREAGRDRLPAERRRGRGAAAESPRTRRRDRSPPRQHRLHARRRGDRRARPARRASSTRPRPASSAPRWRPPTSTSTGRSPRTRAPFSRSPARPRRRCRAGSSLVADLQPRLRPRARELHPRRHLEGGARVARPLPRGRARPAGIRVNAVSGGVVDTDALDHFPNAEQMLAVEPRTHAGRAPGRAARHRRRRAVPLLPGSGDDPRPDARGRRRFLTPV